jgi:hypothetical protein
MAVGREPAAKNAARNKLARHLYWLFLNLIYILETFERKFEQQLAAMIVVTMTWPSIMNFMTVTPAGADSADQEF